MKTSLVATTWLGFGYLTVWLAASLTAICSSTDSMFFVGVFGAIVGGIGAAKNIYLVKVGMKDENK